MEGTVHYNLFYLLQEDQRAHPMPSDRLAALRELLFGEGQAKPTEPPP